MSNRLLVGVDRAYTAINYVAPDYAPPTWLGGAGVAGGNLQTIWAALYARRFVGPAPSYQRERWATPDADFIDIDFLQNSAAPVSAARSAKGTQPLLVLFHGLEGSSRSHYAEAFAHWAREQGWAFAVPHFRGCSGELNLAPRAYHSGDWQEIDWILRRLREQHAQVSSGPVLAVGVSLGGNALMRWAGEMQHSAAQVVSAVASVCSPLDLTASGIHIGQGFNRLVYTRMFLNTMKPRALRKLLQHPGLFSRERLEQSRDLYEFDNVFTAPLHGFKNTDDYWARASAKPHMRHIKIPALALNARNDPFVPASSLPTRADASASVELWQPPFGGHVGFPTGGFPTDVMALPHTLGAWLSAFREHTACSFKHCIIEQ
jgi:uncharacterized protein